MGKWKSKEERKQDERDKRAVLLDKLSSALMEHFDSVQILTTWMDEEGVTHQLKWGRGNWFARQGMARQFMQEDLAQDIGFEIARRMPEDD